MSRANVRIRPACVADVPSLVELTRSVDVSTGAFSGKPLQDASVERLTTRFEEILVMSDRVLLVAVDEAGAVSGLLAARNDDIGVIDPMPVLHMTHLMVAPAARRRGVGRALLAAAAASCWR